MDLRVEAENRAQRILIEKELSSQYKLEKNNYVKTTPKNDIFVIEEVETKELVDNSGENFSSSLTSSKIDKNNNKYQNTIITTNETPRAAYLAEIDYKWNGYKIYVVVVLYDYNNNNVK